MLLFSSLKINQHLIRTRRTASRDKKSTCSTNSVTFPNKAEALEKKEVSEEACIDLFKRPNSSVENSLKRDFYYKENESSHQPSEKITSNLGEIKLSIDDTCSDEQARIRTNTEDIVDGNANLAEGNGSMRRHFFPSNQPVAVNFNEKHEGEAKKTEVKDWECLRRDFHLRDSTGNGSSEKACGKSKEEEQRTYLVINEKSNEKFQEPNRMTRHSEKSIDGIGASNQDIGPLPRKDTTIPVHAITTDMFPSLRTNLSWKETLLSSQCDLLSQKGTTLEETPDQIWSPSNGNVLRNDGLSQVEKKKSNWVKPDDQSKNTQHVQSWTVLENQGKTKMSKTNRTEQFKEPADCEDMWEKRGTRRDLKATPTEELFTCQETAICELSPLADHGVTEKAEAGTAYIIKTTSETTLESMSAREKAIIAKLPQETARSDRLMEVKETVFDPHEGRNDDSHYTLCQGDTVGVIYDNDFKKESCLGICNVHEDEVEKEETICRCHPGTMHDRKKCCIGNKTFMEGTVQVSTNNQKAALTPDLHIRMLPTDRNRFLENRDYEQAQELPKKTDRVAVIHSAIYSDNSRDSPNGSYDHNNMSIPSDKQAMATENIIRTMPLQSSSRKAEYNGDPANKVQVTEQYHSPGSKCEGVFTISEIETSGNRRERCIGKTCQQGDCNMEQSPGPKILITGALENMDNVKHENEEINSGQSLCSSSDKESESSVSTSLFAQESQSESRESLFSKYMHSKISYFLLFLIFLATIYHYDLMIGLAFYLFSLYWLSWEGGRQKESVKKK